MAQTLPGSQKLPRVRILIYIYIYALAEFLPDSQRLPPEALQMLPPAFRDPELPDPRVVGRSRTVQAQGFEAARAFILMQNL